MQKRQRIPSTQPWCPWQAGAAGFSIEYLPENMEWEFGVEPKETFIFIGSQMNPSHPTFDIFVTTFHWNILWWISASFFLFLKSLGSQFSGLMQYYWILRFRNNPSSKHTRIARQLIHRAEIRWSMRFLDLFRFHGFLVGYVYHTEAARGGAFLDSAHVT